jgi:hypothetical protein
MAQMNVGVLVMPHLVKTWHLPRVYLDAKSDAADWTRVSNRFKVFLKILPPIML